MSARITVGWNLRRLRISRGISQEALGLMVGCEPSYVGRIERGGENVGIDLLELLAKALEADMPAFFVTPEPDTTLIPGLTPGRKPAKD